MASRQLAALLGVMALAAPFGASAGGPFTGATQAQVGHVQQALQVYDLALTYIGPGSVGYNQIGTFTFKAFNHGPSTVTGATGVKIVVTFPANYDYPFAANSPSWNCSSFNPSGIVTTTCVYGGTAAANTALAPLVITLQAKHKGGFANCAQISLAAGVDFNPDDNRSCVDGAVT